MMGDVVLVAVASKQAHEESERKSKAIKDGKRRRVLERGEPNGAVQFGYRFHDPEAKHRKRVLDPDESGAYLHVAQMLHDGKTLGDMSRWLYANGFRSKQGKVIAPQRVKYMLANPYYAGKIRRRDGDMVDGVHPALISWEEHERICAKLDTLWTSSKSRGGRRPDQASLLSGGLMRCAHCGKGIWQRKQESGKRDYLCGNVRQKNGACDACSFDAPTVERAVLDHLGGLFVDLGAWIERITAHRADERGVLEREAAEYMREREALEKDEALVRADYMKQLRAENEAAASIAATELERIGDERSGLDAKLADVEARIAEWDDGDSADEVLDWWTEFSAAIREDVIGAESVAEANTALKDRLAAIFVRTEGNVPRLDFVLRERPPGAPLVSSSLWVDENPPDDWPTFLDYTQEDAGEDPVIPVGRHWSGCSR